MFDIKVNVRPDGSAWVDANQIDLGPLIRESRQQQKFAELARKHQALVSAVRRLVHAKRTSNVWLEHTPEYAALAKMVERKKEVVSGE